LRKKNREILVDAWLGWCQPGEFALHACMPFDKSPGTLKDERSGRMEGGKIRLASSLAAQIDLKLGVRDG